MLYEKAIEFSKSLNGSANFKASSGWLHHFKKRHGIPELEVQGDKLYLYHGAAQTFRLKFYNMVVKNSFSRDNMYNADETSINWKSRCV